MSNDYDSTIAGHIYHEILHSICMIEMLGIKELEELSELLVDVKVKDLTEEEDHCQRNVISKYLALIFAEVASIKPEPE